VSRTGARLAEIERDAVGAADVNANHEIGVRGLGPGLGG
jgi:hypothetical protein